MTKQSEPCPSCARKDAALRKAVDNAFQYDGFESYQLPAHAMVALRAALAEAAPAAGETRTLDGKFLIENGRLVKASSGEAIPEDEPLFIMRGRDRLAIPTLLYYLKLSQADGCNDYHFGLLDTRINLFRKFANQHPERMKQPSVTRGAPYVPAPPAAPEPER